jgi:hypothetical protein
VQRHRKNAAECLSAAERCKPACNLTFATARLAVTDVEVTPREYEEAGLGDHSDNRHNTIGNAILEFEGDFLMLPLRKRKDRPGEAVRARGSRLRSTMVTVTGRVFNDPIEPISW